MPRMLGRIPLALRPDGTSRGRSVYFAKSQLAYLKFLENAGIQMAPLPLAVIFQWAGSRVAAVGAVSHRSASGR